MSDSREALEARFRELQARRLELDERQQRLLSAQEMEPALYDRALDQLERDRAELQGQLLDLRRRMQEHGGFER